MGDTCFFPLVPHCELCQPVSICSVKESSWLAAHYMFCSPDASPGDFHKHPCQPGRSFKQQGLSHGVVLLQPENEPKRASGGAA